MYQFLTLIGPGALSFLTIHFFIKDKEVALIDGIAQILVLSLVNNIVTVWFLIQFSKDVLILNEDGTSYVQYGPLDVIFLMLVSVLVSLVIIIIKKRVALSIRVEDKNE